jgi:photosystem II stability/assembly factor-like uncharacterized protein
MKRIHLILAILLITKIAPAQWTSQNSNTVQSLNDIFFADSEKGWIAGNNGVILKTINGGEDWIAKDAGTSAYLQSLYFTDENTGYAVGSSNLIIKSTDAGESWVSLSSGIVDGYLNSICFTDENTGFIVGGIYGPDEVILKTIDGGQNWTRHYSDTNGILTSVFFVNKDIGFATGYHPIEDDWCSLPIVIKTTDGGDTWNSLNVNVPCWCPYPNSIYFVNENLGFVAGSCSTPAHSDGFILKTSDGGLSWSHQFPMDSVFSTGCSSVFFTDNNTGYLAGRYQSDGRVMKTTDGGENWHYQEIPDTTEKCYTVFFPTNNVGYIVGYSGTILKTINGGGPADIREIKQNITSFNLYPNPGRDNIVISFEVLSSQYIDISLFNSNGQLLSTIHHGYLHHGTYQKKLECDNISTGFFLLKLQSSTEIITKKLIIQ